MIPLSVPEIEGGSPERDGGGEEEGQVWGNSRRLDLVAPFISPTSKFHHFYWILKKCEPLKVFFPTVFYELINKGKIGLCWKLGSPNSTDFEIARIAVQVKLPSAAVS